MQGRRSTPTWPFWLCIAIFMAMVAIAVQTAMAETDGHLIYALDDTYIHMAMAKNLAREGVWGCTPYHFSSSSSSPLWTLLLSAVYALTGVRDVTPLLLNVVLAGITVRITDSYLTRFAVPPLLRVVALLGAVVAATMTGLVLMGMEHVLHLLLTIWFAAEAAEAVTAAGEARPARTGTLAILAALLAISRYEGFFLIAVVCLAFLLRGEWARGVMIGTAALVPVVVYGVISIAAGAWFLPNSLMLKAGGTSASPLAVLLKPIGAEDVAFFEKNPGLLLLAIVGATAAVVHLVRERTLWRVHVVVPIWLTLAILLHGHFVFSSTFWAYRYEAYLAGLGVVTAAIALAPLTLGTITRAVRVSQLFAAGALALLMGAVSNPTAALSAQTEIAGARNTYLEHYEAGRFLRAYYPSDAVVVNDLGAVTYLTEARILDLVGLGDIEPLLVTRRTGMYTREDVDAWTAVYRPRLAIIQLDWSWVAPRIPARWSKVAEVVVPTHGQRVGFFAVDPHAAPLLRANVEYHYGSLRRTAGYRVRLF